MKNNRTRLIASTCILLLLVFGWARSPLWPGSQEAMAQECSEHDGCGEREESDGHEHGEEHGDALSMSLDEIAVARCEHDQATYQCDECRYEVGVVKLSDSLLDGASTQKEGLVRTAVAAERKVSVGLRVTGEVRLNENAAVHISPRIPGIIQSVQVDIGARVAQGDVLFKVSSVELGRALADYERSRALTALSKNTYEREKSLFERKIASEQEMIEAQMAYEQHKTELQAAEQVLHVIGLTEEDLSAMQGRAHGVGGDFLPVRAPIDGTIIEKHAAVGELVEPGKEVMLLASLESVWVWADIYEQDLPRLLKAEKEGPVPVRVVVRAFPDRPFEGTIDYVGATMQEKTRTVKVRATVQNPEGLLRPGMFCEIRIGVSNGEHALAVPKAAVLSDEGEDFVFKHWKENYYVRRAVRKGRDFFDAVEILEGLQPGDTIATEGAFLLKSDILREKMGAGCAD